VGGLNIDGCRVNGRERTEYGLANATRSQGEVYGAPTASADFDASVGRWPANVIHDGSEEVLAGFPETGLSSGGRIGKKSSSDVNIVPAGVYTKGDPGYGDTGSAARFFYTAKASQQDRDEGLDHRKSCRAMTIDRPRNDCRQ
jgi:site-specific DNA-methyltransferase (adenine-specific)